MQSFNYTAWPRALTAAVAVFVTVSCIAAAVLWRTRDRHLGVHEDHFDKGVLLYETGSMSAGSAPMVFRPPGYPVFVAATLAIKDAALAVAAPLSGNPRPTGGRRVAVLAAHAVLLGVLGAAVFWFAIDRAGIFAAAACAIAVACNPLLIVVAGHVSYPLLHVLLVTIASLMLLRRLDAGEPGGAVLFRNGLFWGVTTLVKSITLIAPAFILVWASLHFGVRKAARMAAFFAAGVFLVVAPYTARNYAVTGRFIPVNAQASFAFWGTSLQRIPEDANYLHWVTMWFASGMKTYTEVTGVSNYSLAVFEEHVLELGDRFRGMAEDNLRRDPTVYVYNALHNSVVFVVDQPTSYWFEGYAFAWPANVRAARFIAGLPSGVMTAIAVIATVIGCIRRDLRWTLVVALFAMMWVSHALTFLEGRYLYVKLPTIIVGFVLAVAVASSSGGARWRTSAVGVATFAAVLSIVGLFTL